MCGGDPAGGGGSGGGGGGGREYFIHLAIHCTTTWCFVLKGLRTMNVKEFSGPEMSVSQKKVCPCRKASLTFHDELGLCDRRTRSVRGLGQIVAGVFGERLVDEERPRPWVLPVPAVDLEVVALQQPPLFAPVNMVCNGDVSRFVTVKWFVWLSETNKK